MATPSLRGVGPGNTGTGTGAVVVTLPTHVTGDLLVVQIDQNTNATFSGISTGWVALRAAQTNGTGLTQGLYYKVATSSSEPNPSFTPSKTLTWSACSAAFSGVDTVTGIATPNTGVANGAGATTVGFGSFTAPPGQPSHLHVFCSGWLAGTNGAVSAPAGYTERYEIDNGTTVSSWMATRDTLVGPAAPGAVVATSTVSVRAVGQSFVLRSTEYATFRSATNTVGADVTSQTISKPAGAATDDLLILVLSIDSSTIDVTATLNGWTQIGGANTHTSGANSSRTWGFYRRVLAGDGTTYTTPVVDAVGPMTAACACFYRVVASGDPVDGAPSTAVHAAATAVALPAVSPTMTNTTLIMQAGSWAWNTNWSGTAAAMIERIDPATTTNGIMLADEIVTATGTTGTRSVTPTTTGPHTLRMYPIISTTSVGGGPPERTVAGNQPASTGVLARQLQAVRSLAGSQPSATGSLTASKISLRSVAGNQPASTGTLTRRYQAVRAFAGAQPAAAGTLARILQAIRALTGAQPAATGALTRVLQRTRTVAGSQPSPTGALVSQKITFRAVAGNQPASSATLAAQKITARTLAGAQPAATGVLARRLQAIRALAGSQPAASATLARVLVAFRALVGAQPSSSGTLTRTLLKFRTVAGAQPAPTGTLTAQKITARSLTGSQPSATGTLTRRYQAVRSLSGNQPSATGTLVRRAHTSQALTGNQPTPTATLSRRASVSRVLAGDQPAATGTLARLLHTARIMAGNQPSAIGQATYIFGVPIPPIGISVGIIITRNGRHTPGLTQSGRSATTLAGSGRSTAEVP